MSAITALVTDAHRGSAIAIIRSFLRRGYRVVAADSGRRSAGFYARGVAARVVYPDPRREPEAAAAALLAAARRHGVDLLVPVTDDVILPLLPLRAHFSEVCALALPDAAALERTQDKRATIELAVSIGIPVPKTHPVSGDGAGVAVTRGLGWPVVVKPRFSRRLDGGGGVGAFGVSYAHDETALAKELLALRGRCDVLLQEYVPGEGHGVELLMDGGEPVVAFQHRRLREVPFTGGASSFRESVPLDPAMLDCSVRLLAALGWRGLAMVEFRVGGEGPRLMEVNGRVWGSLPLAVRCGVDFPGLLADTLLGQPNGLRNGVYPIGVRSRNVELELAWIGSVILRRRRYPFLSAPSRREAVIAALRLLDPRDGFDVLSARDPLPGLVGAARVAARVPRKLAR